jgi:hypothetical protein
MVFSQWTASIDDMQSLSNLLTNRYLQQRSLRGPPLRDARPFPAPGRVEPAALLWQVVEVEPDLQGERQRAAAVAI